VLRPSSTLSDKLARRLRAIESSRNKLEALTARALLSERATLHMYEGLFLSSHVAFEGFLEELFIGLLVDGQGVESSRSDVGPRITVRSFNIARELIYSPRRPYVDWLPYDRTLELALRFFKGGRPFSDLNVSQKEHLLKCHTIRNVVAHESRDSKAKFERRVIGTTPLPPHERTPAGYLRGLYSFSPLQTRYESFMGQTLLIARNLAK
jgi:hypothetical protein